MRYVYVYILHYFRMLGKAYPIKKAFCAFYGTNINKRNKGGLTMKRFIALLLVISMLAAALAACGTPPDDKDPADTTAADQGPDDNGIDEDGKYTTGFSDEFLRQWSGTTFDVRTVDLHEARMQIDFVEQSDDPVDNAVYKRTDYLEGVMGIDLVDNIVPDYYSNGFVPMDTLIESGDSTYYLANVRCIESIVTWTNGNLYMFDQLRYVDLSKGYWAQDLNPELTLAGYQYVAVGAADLNVYDLIFSLLFSKSLFQRKNNLREINLYDLVKEGKWTVDKMEEVMAGAYFDANSNDVMDEDDEYGYLADNRMVIPQFLDSCEALSVIKDEKDYPQLNFQSDKFYDVMTRVFEIMWDQNNWFTNFKRDNDIPSQCIKMFMNNQSLFLDCSFRYIPSLRNMESEFGIVPYPKWSEQQEDYHSRVAYFFSLIIPNTCKDPDLAGVVLEVLNCYSANEVIPVYKDVALSSKIARDEESGEMIDIIFTHRTIDLGDATFCDLIRDGLLANMFGSDNRNISTLTKQERNLNKTIENYIKRATEAYGSR